MERSLKSSRFSWGDWGSTCHPLALWAQADNDRLQLEVRAHLGGSEPPGTLSFYVRRALGAGLANIAGGAVAQLDLHVGMCMRPRVCVYVQVQANFKRRRTWSCKLTVCEYCECVLASLGLCSVCRCVSECLDLLLCVFVCLTV